MVTAAVDCLGETDVSPGLPSYKLRCELCERIQVCCEMSIRGITDTSQLARAAREVLLSPPNDAPDSRVSQARREACNCYIASVSQDGVFGERLELQALAEVLATQIQLFYYTGGGATPNVSNTSCVPTETFSPKYETNCSIAMLHHVHGNHFEPMLVSENCSHKPNTKSSHLVEFVKPIRMQPYTKDAELHNGKAKDCTNPVSSQRRRHRSKSGGCSCARRQKNNA